MIITTRLEEKNGDTEIHAIRENLPAGVRPEDNEEGWRMSFQKLRKLLAQ